MALDKDKVKRRNRIPKYSEHLMGWAPVSLHDYHEIFRGPFKEYQSIFSPDLRPVYRSVWLGNFGVKTRRMRPNRLVSTPQFPNQTDR